MRWTKEIDEFLYTLQDSKLTYRELQEKYFPHITPNALQQRFKTLGLSKKRGKSNKINHKPLTGAIGQVNPNKPTMLYLVEFPDYPDLYKIGITTTTIEDRMRKSSFPEFNLILSIYCADGWEAMKLENKWKNAIEPYKLQVKVFKSGNTECFIFE